MDELGASDPRTIGAYRLLGRLGSGGMGQVFLARSASGRTVAVKLVREELAGQEEFRRRFRQEIDTARQVGGAWTAPVLDADPEADRPWLASGYVAGPSLHTVVAREHGPLPERSVRILAAGLAHALRDIHAAGVVHRDLKPSNVLLTIDGPRVIDFGIARALETVTDGGLTRAGALVGSPAFMAPEQLRGDPVTPACDVFCLGSVLAYAATGRLPFGAEGSGAHALMFRIAQEEPDLRALPKPLRELVHACLAKAPEHRPSLDAVLRHSGAHDTVADGRAREPWLPGTLIAQLGRHAARLLDVEDPGAGPAVRVPEPRSPVDDEEAGVGLGLGLGLGTGLGTGMGMGRGGPCSGHPSISGPGPGTGTGPGPGPGPRPEADADADADAEGDLGVAGAEPAPGAEPEPEAEAGPGPAEPHTQALPTPPHPVGFGHPATGGASAALPGTGDVPATPGGGPETHPETDPETEPEPEPETNPETDLEPHPETDPETEPETEPRAQRNGRTTAFLVAAAVTVAIGAGGSVYAVMNGEGTGRTEQRRKAPPTAPATPAAVPESFLGTWQHRTRGPGGPGTRTLTLTQGTRGERVMRLREQGPHHDCASTARLRSADPTTVTLGPATLTYDKGQSCRPGAARELTLPDEHTLVVRRLDGNGPSKTYTRTTGR
ncbi:protein kinase [Streptomyces sp. B-S-A8]|uniref:Protein kinase n=1 Tax=Streptomyces solicavernae TaxID=3043614 RepID=A0ABT6RJP7_9ACTN|nr:protein kinase [Streptomyces sp. B-S-A8]MDI3384649.1 protein kinase [Streptomyces sp. B-S-A8]